MDLFFSSADGGARLGADPFMTASSPVAGGADPTVGGPDPALALADGRDPVRGRRHEQVVAVDAPGVAAP